MPPRGLGPRRNIAIVFGLVLVLMVVIVGIAVGLGHPSVPSDDVAVVDDSSINVPGLAESGHISKTNFNRFLLQTAKQNGLQSPPTPGSANFQQIKDQAMQTALQIAWIVGEAGKEGINPTQTQVNQALQQIKSQFKSQAEYVKARDQAGLTDADVLERARLQVIQSQIQDKINNNVSTPSQSDAKTFYDANKTQFSQPAQRTIRIVQNKDANQVALAYKALQADHSPAGWKKIAAQYSTDPTSKEKGGLRTGVVPGSFAQPLDDDIFKAPTGVVQAPVTTSTGTYVFEVITATPAKTQGFNDPISSATGASGTVAQQIIQQLRSQAQQQALSDFGADFRDYWTNKTQCASGYVVSFCDNFKGGPSCDLSKQSAQPGQAGGASCPAPVFSSCQESGGQQQCTGSGPTPAAPGSIKPFITSSFGTPQGPHPPGAATAPSSPGISFPGVSGAGAPPGG